MSTSGAQPAVNGEPVFGFVLFGGPMSGAMVRDVRLANELVDRGYRVHVWWVMDRADNAGLDRRIHQRWLVNGARYFQLPLLGHRLGPVLEPLGRRSSCIFHYKNRMHVLQKRPQLLDRFMTGMLRAIAEGVEADTAVVRRFARQLSQTAVTHVLPMLAMLCPWVAEARRYVDHELKYLVTFQGYELYINFARRHRLEKQLYRRFVDAVEQSDYPAIAVSDDYRQRVIDDVGVLDDRIVTIPPGVPIPSVPEREQAIASLERDLGSYQRGVPLITFVGRRDGEKGIDLLIYAAAILKRRGVTFQLAVCGPTLFGSQYAKVCTQISEDLGCPVMWRRFIPDSLRAALFRGSDCVVYPSIHREPFGMVPVEAMSYGTPVVVPDYGGVASVIEANGACGGVRFRAWDSGDLADQLHKLLSNQTCWRRLSDDGPKVAAYFSVANLANRVLEHLGLGRP